ncbi:rhamnan synthesis F family protein [Clostridium thermarum]|uniref:rhamnan synthesis F family protein n=1 Tax=Clostridium thermarum TaxID=1716543 RepID=UPI0011225E40|nr:rhamnan synthesis F family protein [Clostridium thermarum]
MSSTFENTEQLSCILPADYSIDSYYERILTKRIAVVMHMHYFDTFDKYKQYIDNIPKEIHIYFTTSNNEIRKKIELFLEHRKNCMIIEKNNRGRDISSFLVACRKEILKYEYVCFLHDKREKDPSMKKDIDRWIYSQWENMLGTSTYIYNVLSYFDKNSQIGLLLPPIPIGEHLSFLYRNNWYNNYDNTIKLAKRLDLHCNVNKEISPMALGTVYWARVDALKKLLEYEWKYEDFDAEPLADDGTISHAIERILEYVAKDAGYESKWVMTDRYAQERLGDFTNVLSKAFERLRKSLGLRNIYDLDRFDYKALELKEICQNYKKVYIYGAGIFGRDCLHFMKAIDVRIDAFIVTNMAGNESEIENISVYSLNEIEFDNETIVIVAVKKEYQEEIFKKLKENGLPTSAICNWRQY